VRPHSGGSHVAYGLCWPPRGLRACSPPACRGRSHPRPQCLLPLAVCLPSTPIHPRTHTCCTLLAEDVLAGPAAGPDRMLAHFSSRPSLGPCSVTPTDLRPCSLRGHRRTDPAQPRLSLDWPGLDEPSRLPVFPNGDLRSDQARAPIDLDDRIRPERVPLSNSVFTNPAQAGTPSAAAPTASGSSSWYCA